MRGEKLDRNGTHREQGAKPDVQVTQEKRYCTGVPKRVKTRGQQAIPSISNCSRHLDYGWYSYMHVH